MSVLLRSRSLVLASTVVFASWLVCSKDTRDDPFSPATVVSLDNSGPDTKLISVSAPRTPRFSDAICTLYIRHDDIQIERPYTPLGPPDEHGRLTFWIKRYPRGDVARWIHAKNVGDTIHLRGPVSTWQWNDRVWDDIVMISGGTGITPFVQLFNTHITGGPAHRTRFTLLHSSRSPAELPPPAILDPLLSYSATRPDRFQLHLFVDTLDGSEKDTHRLRVGRIGKTAIEHSLGLKNTTSWWHRILPAARESQDRKILFLVCGPPPMIEAISGPYGPQLSQGVVGGVLGHMGFASHQVYKL